MTAGKSTMEPIEGGRAQIPAGHLRQGLRLYAIGDIHGQAALLDRMAERVAADLAADPPDHALTLCLGDYIDRGPRTDAVIDRLVRRDFPTDLVTLRGNHEQLMLDALARSRAMDDWLVNGGDTTAASYGVGESGTASHEALRRKLLDRLPDAHRLFLEQTILSRAIDGYFFCHAGIMPGVPLNRQSAETLLWIRGPFHRSEADHGKVVVHGHTPVREPESLPNRINIDTGAFKSGVLTAVVLEGATRRFLHVGR